MISTESLVNPSERPIQTVAEILPPSHPEIQAPSSPKRARNRANARLSTGPKTTRGKKQAARNSLKHGFLSTEIVVAAGLEDPADYKELLAELKADHKPQGVQEELLVELIANCMWRLRRVIRFETASFSRGRQDSQKEISHASSLSTGFRAGIEKMLSSSDREQACPEDPIAVLILIYAETNALGFVEELRLQLLRQCFGVDDEEFVAKITDVSKAAAKAEKEGRATRSYQDQVLRLIKQKIARESRDTQEEQRPKLVQGEEPETNAFLDDKALNQILRYQAAIERQMYRALDELERLQRRRKGDLVPPPLNVQVSHYQDKE